MSEFLLLVIGISIYFASAMLAVILARITSRDFSIDQDKDCYRVMAGVFGPIGLLITLFIYLVFYLPAQWIKDE